MPALFQNGLHVTCAIKEEEKIEKRVGSSKSERESKVGKRETVETGEETRQRRAVLFS